MRNQFGEISIRCRNLAHVIAAIVALAAPILLAQRAASPTRLKFAVASVRPIPAPGPGVTPTLRGVIKCLGVDGLLWTPERRDPTAPRQGRCIGPGVTPRAIVQTAYASSRPAPSPPPRVVLPPNASAELQTLVGDRALTYVSMEAVADDPERVTKGELQQMLQALLEDRFKARIHTETRELDGFVLTIAKSGIKFKENTSGERVRVGFPPGVPLPPGVTDNGDGRTVIGPFAIYDTHPMAQLVQTLERALGSAPIADKTGLTGTYDIRFGLDLLPPLVEPAPGVRGGGGPQNQPPRFKTPVQKAVEDQLGLHLEPAKLPVEFIVIDHMEPPTEN